MQTFAYGGGMSTFVLVPLGFCGDTILPWTLGVGGQSGAGALDECVLLRSGQRRPLSTGSIVAALTVMR